MTAWKLKTKGSIFNFKYFHTIRRMECKEGYLDKSIGYPEQRRTLASLLVEIKSNKRLSLEPFKFIRDSSVPYLEELDVHLTTRVDKVEGGSLLHHVAQRTDPQFLHCILSKYQNLDVRDDEGFTPLHWACSMGNFENARILLEHGANVNVASDSEKLSPLMILAKKAKPDPKMVRLLLKYNASCEAENFEYMRPIDIARNVNPCSSIIALIHPLISQI